VASCLLASLSAAGGELRLERVTLSVEQRPRGDGARVEEGLAAFERNGKAYLQRALDSLEPLAASRAGQGLTATVSALREDLKHSFFDASRVHDGQLLERALRLREELQRHPAASSAVSDLLRVVQQAAFVSLSDARLLFGTPPSPVHAPRVAKGTPAFREAERAWEEASQQLAQGREQDAGPSLLRAWSKSLEAMSHAGVHFRPGEVSDVDGDGVPDQLEVRFGASPLSVDTDGDGLTDGFELRWGGAHLLPASADTDGDGRADGVEDLDGDGRASLQEQARGTDPLQSDTRVDTLATMPRSTARPTPKVLAVALPGAGKRQPSGAAPDPFDTDGGRAGRCRRAGQRHAAGCRGLGRRRPR